MPGLVFTLLMILFLVVVHEMGHFFAARVFNVPVRSIHIGFGKQIFDSTRSRPRKPGDAATGRVKIVLGWLPLGGYIEMAEPGDAAVAAGQQATAYRRQPVHRRALIALAGPAANLLFAFCLYWLMLVLGTQDVKPVVATPAPNTPAAVAGVRAGDTVMDANGVPVLGWRGVRVALVEHIVSGLPLTLTVRDAAGSVRLLTMDLSHISTAITNPATAAGLRLDIPHIPIVARAGPLSGAVLAMENTRRMAMLTLRGLGQYVFRHHRTDGNAEPAAHAVTAGNVTAPHPSGFAAAESVSAGWIGLLSFIAYLSINLGIVNLLPLPLLDGGEIVLLYAERVVGHRLSAISRKAWVLAGVSVVIAVALAALRPV